MPNREEVLCSPISAINKNGYSTAYAVFYSSLPQIFFIDFSLFGFALESVRADPQTTRFPGIPPYFSHSHTHSPTQPFAALTIPLLFFSLPFLLPLQAWWSNILFATHLVPHPSEAGSVVGVYENSISGSANGGPHSLSTLIDHMSSH